jgi:hypothetical protein
MGRLQDLLFAEAIEPDLHALVGRETEALLAHPALSEIARAEDVEIWLAHSIVEGIPRSDAMIAPAMRRFDWQQRGASWDCPPVILDVLDRYRDCRFRNSVAQRIAGDYGAFKALTGPAPSWPGLLRPIKVKGFLRDLRREHPSVERDLDAQTVAWWDALFERRRKRIPFGTAALIALGLAMLQRLAMPDLEGTPWLLLIAAIYAATLVWFALRCRIQQRREADEELWWVYGPLSGREAVAFLAAFILPVAAILTPPGAIAVLGYGLAAALLGLAANPAATGDSESRVTFAWQSRLCLLAPIVWAHALWSAGPVWLQAVLPVCAAAWIAATSGDRIAATLRERLGERTDRLSRPARGVFALAGFALWFAMIGMIGAVSDPAWRPLLSIGAVILLLAHHLIDPPDPYQHEWGKGSIVAVLVVAFGGPPLAALVVAWRSLRTVARLAGS